MPGRPFPCPHCGATVPARALACPECGSDAESGWSEDAEAWAGDLPVGYGDDDDLDDEEFLREEGLAEDGAPSAAARRHRRNAVICLVLALAALAWVVTR